MGKTESIKERRVDVYLDTLDRKERWTRIADEERQSLSKFVQKSVEYAIESGGPDYAELGDRNTPRRRSTRSGGSGSGPAEGASAIHLTDGPSSPVGHDGPDRGGS